MNNPYAPTPQRPDRGQEVYKDPTARRVILRMALAEHRRNAR